MESHLFEWFDLKSIEKFKKFHTENPTVYEEFSRLAHGMLYSGRKKYSVDALIHVIRWNIDIKTNGETFKIDNNIRSIYGRLLAFYEPEFVKFFNFHVKRTKIKPPPPKDNELFKGTPMDEFFI